MVFHLCRRCGVPTPNTPAICDACKASNPERKREVNRYYDSKQRDKRANAFYHSVPWRECRAAYLASIGYLCEDCVAEAAAGVIADDDIRVATDVHHVVPISDDWSLRLTWSNLRGLCDRHHKQKRALPPRGVGKKVREPLLQHRAGWQLQKKLPDEKF